MELYLPPTYAKINRGCEFYETTERFKRRSAASKETMTMYWSDKRHRRRIDKKQAKPVDVFDLEGNFVAAYPSARKCAIAMFPDIDYHKAERCIRSIRQGGDGKKSYRGFMFRDHEDGVTKTEPYARKPKPSGYHVERRPGTFATKAATAESGGTVLRFRSLKECAASLKVSYGGIWAAMKDGRTIKGWTITKEEKRKQQ